MEISPAQCRAARALLNWTRDKLAVKTVVALKTIRGFENERQKPLGVTRAAIKQALEAGWYRVCAGVSNPFAREARH